MILKVYAIHDQKADAFMVPHFAATHGLMTRMFTDAIQDPQSNLHKHPGDFTLYYIGDYDDSTGNLTARRPEPLGSALDFSMPPNVQQLRQEA